MRLPEADKVRSGFEEKIKPGGLHLAVLIVNLTNSSGGRILCLCRETHLDKSHFGKLD